MVISNVQHSLLDLVISVLQPVKFDRYYSATQSLRMVSLC